MLPTKLFTARISRDGKNTPWQNGFAVCVCCVSVCASVCVCLCLLCQCLWLHLSLNPCLYPRRSPPKPVATPGRMPREQRKGEVVNGQACEAQPSRIHMPNSIKPKPRLTMTEQTSPNLTEHFEHIALIFHFKRKGIICPFAFPLGHPQLRH